MVRVLFVEASSGGVVGGSLTGLYHLIRGLDRARFAAAMVLYEHKEIETELRAMSVPVHHVSRRRVPKQHALLQYDGYHRAKSVGAVRSVLGLGRQSLRIAVEELPAAMQLARVIRRGRRGRRASRQRRARQLRRHPGLLADAHARASVT